MFYCYIYIINSLRSIQSTIEKFFNTKISIRLIEKWIKTFVKLLKIDVKKNKEEEELKRNKGKSKTYNLIEIDELFTYFYDLKKNEENMSKYGLLLTEEQVKLLHIK